MTVWRRSAKSLSLNTPSTRGKNIAPPNANKVKAITVASPRFSKFCDKAMDPAMRSNSMPTRHIQMNSIEVRRPERFHTKAATAPVWPLRVLNSPMSPNWRPNAKRIAGETVRQKPARDKKAGAIQVRIISKQLMKTFRRHESGLVVLIPTILIAGVRSVRLHIPDDAPLHTAVGVYLVSARADKHRVEPRIKTIQHRYHSLDTIMSAHDRQSLPRSSPPMCWRLSRVYNRNRIVICNVIRYTTS